MQVLRTAASSTRERRRTGGRDRLMGGVAALAFAVVLLAPATAAAATAPQLGRCVKVAKHTGDYGSDRCTSAKARGNFEWMPGAVEPGFSISAQGVEFVNAEEGEHVKCTSATGHGSYEGDTQIVGLSLTFTGCQQRPNTCSSAGAAAGEIVSNPLEGEYVYHRQDDKKALLAVFGADRSGPLWSFTCGPETIAILGSLLAAPTANRMELTNGLGITANHEGEQGETSYQNADEEIVTDVLEEELNEPGLSETQFTPVALSMSKNRQTNEEELELNSAL